MRKLDDLDLENIEGAARGKSRGKEGACFAHPADTLRLVVEAIRRVAERNRNESA